MLCQLGHGFGLAGVFEPSREVVEHSAVAGVERVRGPRGVRGQDVVRVNLQGGAHLAFKEFTGGDGDLDGALALLEHLTSSD